MITRDEEVIVAQATPSGRGAIALIRMSGSDVFAIADRMAALPAHKTITAAASHTIHVGTVINERKEPVDQVLFLIMRAPHTFTGQDTVEISCHNNPFIIQAIIAQALRNGARVAQPGEFTKRAYLNKKIDLIQAEAINELICAHTQQAIQKSLAQLQGSFSHWLTTIEHDLTQALALTQASFEFLDDETITFDQQISEIVTKTLQTITTIEESYTQQQHIKEGIRIVLLGSVNAGKSSLFNQLVKQDRAIVTAIAGTTRDTIEAGVYRAEYYATYVDTAGLRQTADAIEQEGIKRSWQQAQTADIIVLVIDGQQRLREQELVIYREIIQQYAKKIIVVSTKSDLDQQYTSLEQLPVLALSNITSHNIQTLEELIKDKALHILNRGDTPFLVNQRQFALLKQLRDDLGKITELIKTNFQHELVAVHLQDALERLTELTGKTVRERSVDAIFQEFCVGK